MSTEENKTPLPASPAAKNMFLRLINAVAIVVILAACFYPFGIRPCNQLSPAPQGTGMLIGEPGIVYTTPMRLKASAGPVRIDIAATPHDQPRYHIGRLVTICDTAWQERLIIGQWRHHLLIRAIDPLTGNQTTWDEDSVFAVGRRSDFTIIIGNDFLTVTDLQTEAVETTVDPAFYRSIPAYGCVCAGNGTSGNRQWTGILHTLQLQLSGTAIALDSHPGQFITPAFYPILQQSFLRPPREFNFNRELAIDLVLNFAGFFIFGFLLVLLLIFDRRLSPLQSLLLTSAAGLFISLSAETGQLFLYMRTSQMTDLVLNTSGAFLGALAAVSALWLKRGVLHELHRPSIRTE